MTGPLDDQIALREFVREVNRAPGRNPQPKVTPFTFAGTWTAIGASPTPGYYMTADGHVAFQGGATGGGANLITTLPQTHWPAAEQRWAVPSNSLFGEVRVLPNGQVEVVVGGFVNVFLDSIRFLVA